MSGLRALVSTVLESTRASLVVPHRSRLSGYSLEDVHGNRHIDQSCLGVFDCKGLKAVVGREVELQEWVEGCARTYRFILADSICV